MINQSNNHRKELFRVESMEHQSLVDHHLLSIDVASLKPEEILCSSAENLLEKLGTSQSGLSTEVARDRIEFFGPNDVAMKKKRPLIVEFLKYFKSPLILILLGAAIISGLLFDLTDMSIIIFIVIMSVFLDFIQEHRAGKAAEELQKRIQTTTTALRDGVKKELPLAEFVPGDIIVLSAGEIVPADARILAAKDLFSHQSAMTGESIPVEKSPDPIKPEDVSSIAKWTNCLFMGASILSGTGIAVVVKTGTMTEYGKIIMSAIEKKPETEFDKSTKRFGMFLLKVTVLLVGFVFLVKAWQSAATGGSAGTVVDSLLFAVALSVGLTPDLLPMIISVNLSKSAVAMSKKKVIVKRLNSIQNFGSMDVLCTDKTGTLTENKIVMVLHVDIEGKSNDKVFQYSYLNSYFETGLKSPLDDAILDYKDREEIPLQEYEKDDEIPFDFTRKRVSVILKQDTDLLMLTKGAPDEVENICKYYEFGGEVNKIDDQARALMEKTYRDLSMDGYRLLGVAYKYNPFHSENFSIQDEFEMIFLGYVAFLDPPKKSTKEAVDELLSRGIKLKILTGDNELVTRKVCQELGIEIQGVLLGKDIMHLSNEDLARVVDNNNIFAQVIPSQKERIIAAFKQNGHVVGFMGDGINDTPPMKAADVSISVENAVDVAKETADIILLEEDLRVLSDGVLEGRVTFGNTEKYMKYSISSNFGTMFSAAISSVFIPFLPMTASQVLLNNLLNDIAQLPLPADSVDKEYVERPRRLSIPFISRFMVAFGPLSSIFDNSIFITMFILFPPFNATNISLFQTAFFAETLTCQLVIIFVIRTQRLPFYKSKPSKLLTLSVLIILALTLILSFIPGLGAIIGFSALPPIILPILAIFWVIYIVIVEIMTKFFYKKYGRLG